MRRALHRAGLMVAAAGLASPPPNKRHVTNGFVRSNVLLPIGGKKAVSNPVPQDLSDLSGWTREELEVGLEKQYDVDVADVTRFLYSTEGDETATITRTTASRTTSRPSQRHHSRC